MVVPLSFTAVTVVRETGSNTLNRYCIHSLRKVSIYLLQSPDTLCQLNVLNTELIRSIQLRKVIMYLLQSPSTLCQLNVLNTESILTTQLMKVIISLLQLPNTLAIKYPKY